ncbi:MAG: hypothetical protein JWM81_1167 [Candidatus Saccharibacteria bacterium]|nr:hypothetical protein [Candidatus Saccharibacteria bacterium]
MLTLASRYSLSDDSYMLEVQQLGDEVYAVHRAFAATEHGATLAENIRYQRYNLAHLSNQEWTALLGADVNNLTHMPLTYGLTKSFIKQSEALQPGFLDDEEETTLMLAAIIHDQGEAIVTDITYSDKTAADETEEKLQFDRNLEAFCPGATLAMKRRIIQAKDEVVFNSATKLGQIFNAIERAGYVRTALRAAEHIQAGTAGDAAAGLRWIIADVFGAHPAKLIDYAQTYPVIRQYLVAQQPKITAAFGVVLPQDFENYGAAQHDKETAFQQGWLAWQEWLCRE